MPTIGPNEGIFDSDSIGSARQDSLLILNTDAGSVWMEELRVRINDGYGLGQRMMVLWESAIPPTIMSVATKASKPLWSRELYGWSPIHHSPDDTVEKLSLPNTVSATQVVLLSVGALVRE